MVKSKRIDSFFKRKTYDKDERNASTSLVAELKQKLLQLQRSTATTKRSFLQ